MNAEYEIESDSELQTNQIGQRIAQATRPGQVFALSGQLGSGKTALTRTICSALGIDRDSVNSPTFVLMQLYHGSDHKIAHFDTYRLADADEFLAVGGEEYLLSDEYICLVEWAERISDLLPSDHVYIKMTQTGATSRHIHLTAHGPQSTMLVENLASEYHEPQ